MRTIDEHLAEVLALAAPRTESLLLVDATGHALASPAHARFAVPPFDNAAMDGFAVRASDLEGDLDGDGPWTLPVAGDIPAGADPVDCPQGHVVRIMTGAPIPASIDDLIVIPVEQTNIERGPVELPKQVTINAADAKRGHIRRAGSDTPVGAVVADVGTVIDAPTLAALVSTGVREVEVYALPRVAVITTGDELVSWPEPITGAQIPNSNAPLLAQIARDAGAAEVTELHASDGAEDFARTLNQAAKTHDLVVTAGGVSAGAFDVVRHVAKHNGSMWFGHVAQRPGGPQGVGVSAGAPLVCLPGNPVAAFVSAHMYLVPLIRAFAGNTRPRPQVRAITAEGFPQPHPKVTRLIPVRLDYSGAEPVAHAFSQHVGSHMVASLTGIDGIAHLAPGDTTPQHVHVMLTTL